MVEVAAECLAPKPCGGDLHCNAAPRRAQASQVVLGESDHKIQALPPQRADEPFAKCVRLRTLRWRFHDPQPQVACMLVEMPREDRITIMNEELINVYAINFIP